MNKSSTKVQDFIMNAAFVDVGFGFAPAVSGASTYATLVLARPR